MESPIWDFEGFGPIRVQLHFTAHTPESLREVLDRQSEMFASAEFDEVAKYFVVIDARSLERPSPAVRKIQAEWIKQHREYFARTCLGMAFVVRSKLVRGALTAIFWVVDSPVPYTVHASLQDALDHAAQACAGAGIDVPVQVRRRGAEIIEAAIPDHFREPARGTA